MTFNKTIMYGQEVYLSGKYKVVKYGKWTAFFKPDGWTAFGNACAKTPSGETAHFKTLRKAMSICKEHAKKFKEDLGQFNSLIVR